MTKYPKVKKVLTTCAAILVLALAAVGIISCLDPVGFNPDLKFTIDANISGDIDVYNVNNAVLWVINMTRTVDVDLQTIEVVGDRQPAGYPFNWTAPKAGHSFASYHRPHPPREKADTGPVQPYTYKVSLSLRDPKKANEAKNLWLNKQLPMPKDYAVFLVRRSSGELELVDEQPPLHALDPDDTDTDPALPSGRPVFPLIVRNVTKNADIESINFGTSLTQAQAVYGNINDQKTWYLPAADYPTYVTYKLKSSGITGESVHITVPPVPPQTEPQLAGPNITVIDKDQSADSASWHLLFMYFYLAKDKTYKVTQQWPPLLGDQDDQGNIEGDFEHARIRVLNTVSATAVTGIAVKDPNSASNFYGINSAFFQPSGDIGTGNDVNRHSKVAIFDPNTANSIFGSQAGRFTGEPYEVWLNVDDSRLSSTIQNRVVKYKGVPLMVGETYVIILKDSDVNEGGPSVVVPVPATYTVTADGGTESPALAAYDTTTLTFTFNKDVSGTPTFTKTGGSATVGTLSGGPRVFTASVTTSVQPSENITLKCTAGAAAIDDSPHQVTVYKHTPASTGITTYRYIYKDSGYTNAMPLQRNQTHQLQWFFEYEIRKYVDGVEDTGALQVVRKNNYGSWLIDNSNNSPIISYVTFQQNISTSTGSGTASLLVGPHPGTNKTYMRDPADVDNTNQNLGDRPGKPAGYEWNFSTGLVFGFNEINITFFGIPVGKMNIGTNVVDGHVIENMVSHNVPLYYPTGGLYKNQQVYGHPVTLRIRN
jgi:hypothetical protein